MQGLQLEETFLEIANLLLEEDYLGDNKQLKAFNSQLDLEPSEPLKSLEMFHQLRVCLEMLKSHQQQVAGFLDHQFLQQPLISQQQRFKEIKVHQLLEDFLEDQNQLNQQAVEQVSLEHQNRIKLQVVVDLDNNLNQQALGLVSLEDQNQLNHLVVVLANLLQMLVLQQPH